MMCTLSGEKVSGYMYCSPLIICTICCPTIRIELTNGRNANHVREDRQQTSHLNFRSFSRLTDAPRDQSTEGSAVKLALECGCLIRSSGHVPRTTLASLSVSRSRFFIVFIQFVTSNPSERPWITIYTFLSRVGSLLWELAL